MLPIDDLSKEESDLQNQELMAFLHHVYQGKAELSAEEQAQSLRRARERLFDSYQTLATPALNAKKSEHLYLLEEAVATQPRSVPLPQQGWRRRLTVMAAVALLLLLVGSSLLIFKQASQGDGITHPGVTSRATPVSRQDARELAHMLVSKLRNAAENWGQAHLYHNPYNSQDYLLDGGYIELSKRLDAALVSAQTTSDYQEAIQQARDALFNLQMLETNYNDRTPASQVHQTDILSLQRYQAMNGTVLVISLTEQELRVFVNGSLRQAFQVTTGRVKFTTLPGHYQILQRLSPVVFKSSQPKTSPDWYADTPVTYALEYQVGGYWIFDSWWRESYGPGAQFPHNDASGNSSSSDGSQQGISLSKEDAARVYAYAQVGTKVIIY